MEYLSAVNIATGVIVLLMISCLAKLFAGDIGTNKTFYILAFIALGVGLYLWRSGAAGEVLSTIFGSGNAGDRMAK